MAGDGDVIADKQFARLQKSLAARGVREGRCAFGDVWAAASDWMLTAPEDALGDGSMVGWECSRNPNDGSLEHSDPPMGVPAGPLFSIALFWSFADGGEAGVEFWFQADADWETLTLDPDWDPEHMINLHGWGHPGPRAAEFTTYLETLPHLSLAASKQAVLFRVFKTGSPEIAWRCA